MIIVYNTINIDIPPCLKRNRNDGVVLVTQHLETYFVLQFCTTKYGTCGRHDKFNRAKEVLSASSSLYTCFIIMDSCLDLCSE